MRVAVGDISSETSMEDILSSIKRIIAEEGDGAGTPVRARKPIRPTQPLRDYDDEDEILELDETVAAPPPAPPPAPRIERARAAEPVADRGRAPEATPVRMSDPDRAPERPRPPETERVRAPEPEPMPAQPEETPSILSDRAAEATRESLDQLSRMLVKPETPGADSLEGLVREMLRPMLRDWLDAKLPTIVESMVAREIARISGRE